MRAKGYTVEEPDEERDPTAAGENSGASAPERGRTRDRGEVDTAGWQRAGDRRTRQKAAQRFKERLQEFKRM